MPAIMTFVGVPTALCPQLAPRASLMAFEALLAFTGAVLGGCLAIFVLLANPRLFIHRVFASGMCALVLGQICAGMGAQAVLPADIVPWEYLRLRSAAFRPGNWLRCNVHCGRAKSRPSSAQLDCV